MKIQVWTDLLLCSLSPLSYQMLFLSCNCDWSWQSCLLPRSCLLFLQYSSLFTLLLVRPSHNLGAGHKALTLPGSVGLEWGACRAGFVELSQSQAETNWSRAGPGRTNWRLGLFMGPFPSSELTLREGPWLLYSLIPSFLEQYLSPFMC